MGERQAVIISSPQKSTVLVTQDETWQASENISFLPSDSKCAITPDLGKITPPTSPANKESQMTSEPQPPKFGPSADFLVPTLMATLWELSQTVNNHIRTTNMRLR